MLQGSIETPPLFGEAVEEQLFDLDADPGERASLLAANPPQLRTLRSALRAYRDLCERSAYSPLEITERLEVDPEALKNLESLGYL